MKACACVLRHLFVFVIRLPASYLQNAMSSESTLATKGRDDEAPRIGIAANLTKDICDLIDRLAAGRWPGSPLSAINWAQFALLVRPFVPDRNIVFLQISDIGIALEKPQELVDDRFQVQFLGRDHWEPVRQIKPHLMAEDAKGAGPRAIVFPDTVLAHALEEIEILLHGN